METDFFSPFFTSINCRIEKLHLIKCIGVDVAFTALKEVYEKYDELLKYLTLSL
jgi:hypothetical protein